MELLTLETNARAISIAALCPTVVFDPVASVPLRQAGSNLTSYRTLPGLLAACRTHRFDAVVLQDDRAQLRHWLSAVRMELGLCIPVVVFGSGGTDFLARALRGGADDYATYQDGTEALFQRLEARAEARSWTLQTSLHAGGCFLHADRRTLADEQRETSLTGREFALAWTLFENFGRTVSLNMLAGEVWGRPCDICKRTVEQHVYRLRRKLALHAKDAVLRPRIETVHGVGYRALVHRTGATASLA